MWAFRTHDRALRGPALVVVLGPEERGVHAPRLWPGTRLVLACPGTGQASPNVQRDGSSHGLETKETMAPPGGRFAFA